MNRHKRLVSAIQNLTEEDSDAMDEAWCADRPDERIVKIRDRVDNLVELVKVCSQALLSCDPSLRLKEQVSIVLEHYVVEELKTVEMELNDL